jgi:hypothetical protein
MPLFDSAIAKIERALEQTDTLEREIAAFFSGKTYEVREDINPETRTEGGHLPLHSRDSRVEMGDYRW